MVFRQWRRSFWRLRDGAIRHTSLRRPRVDRARGIWFLPFAHWSIPKGDKDPSPPVLAHLGMPHNQLSWHRVEEDDMAWLVVGFAALGVGILHCAASVQWTINALNHCPLAWWQGAEMAVFLTVMAAFFGGVALYITERLGWRYIY